MADSTTTTINETPLEPVTPPQGDPMDQTTGISAFDWLQDQIQSLGLTIWDILSDLLLLVVDLFMELGLFILSGLVSVFNLMDVSQYISQLPIEVVQVMSVTGLGTAIGMVMTAGATRLLMQLIPFVRLGS